MRRLRKMDWLLVTAAPVVAISAMLITGTSTMTDAHAADVNSETLKYWQSPDNPSQEAWIDEPMPPEFQVVVTQLEGPVFADGRGRTLYTWPLDALRNGSTGDREGGVSQCTDKVLRYSAGLMSPYPAGLLLPDLEQRRSCVEVWPPVLASDEAEEVGKWTTTERQDGTKQWAYDGYPLYTSILDKEPGDVLGGTKIRSGGDGGVVRVPVGPAPNIPPEFDVIPSTTGRLIVNSEEYSVYTWDGDEPNKSNCHDECLADWSPVIAPETAVEQGKWTTVERSPGINQWAFGGKPLYTYDKDLDIRSFLGADVPGWHNVYTQRALPPPEEFTVQDAAFGGQVLADSRGRTIYLYNCRDDSLAQLACDHPDTTQAYRLAICGDGDPALCREAFPYVVASPDAKVASRLWSVMAINPNTGRRAAPGEPDTLHVWAYRDRPVYTYGGDHSPGVTNGDGFGEFTGRRNGYKAFVLRDIFQGNEFRR